MTFGWSPEVRKRADRAHARKKRARAQRRYLCSIKTPAELRAMVLAVRYGPQRKAS